MAPLMTLTTIRSSEPLHHADPELLLHRSQRREALRRGVIAAVTLALATLLFGLAYVVGPHVLAAWWLERLNGAVLWNIDETNWRQGGATSVSFFLRNAWDRTISDSELNHLRKLHRVVSLNLSENDRITTTGLAALRGLEFVSEVNLERLDRYREHATRLTSIPLTDACLAHLRRLPRLETLILSGNLITDRGLPQIAQMANLKNLDLEATEVSDAGLVQLAGMKELEMVNLGATRVTTEGISRLRMARPDLLIELETDPAVERGVSLARGSNQ